MKILMYGKYKPYKSNGVYTAIEHLTKSLVNHGHEILIVSPSSNIGSHHENFAQKNGFTLSTCRGRFGIWSLRRYLAMLNSFKPDVIHFQYVRYPSQLFVALIGKCLGIQQTISIHDGYSEGYFQNSHLKKYMYFFLIDFWLIQLVNSVHCVSAREKRELQRWSLSGTKFHVIPNVFVRDSTKASLNKTRSKSFGFLGRIDFQHKNIEYQARLIDRLPYEVSQGGFHICGPLLQKNKRLMMELGSRLSIDMIQYDPMFGVDKNNFLKDTKVFMHASNWELFGYSMLEAIEAGCHLVISQNCDLADTLKHKSFVTILSGEYAEDEKLLLSALSKFGAEPKIANEREAFLDTFNSSSTLERYEQLYRGDC